MQLQNQHHGKCENAVANKPQHRNGKHNDKNNQKPHQHFSAKSEKAALKPKTTTKQKHHSKCKNGTAKLVNNNNNKMNDASNNPILLFSNKSRN